MREQTAEDVFGPIVSRYLWEKSSPNQRQADETAGRLQAIERLSKELTTEPLLEQPPKLLDVIREQQSVEDQWQAFRELAEKETNPRRTTEIEGEMETLRVESLQRSELIRDLLLDAHTSRTFALLAALIRDDNA